MTVLIVNHNHITSSVKLQSCHKGGDVTVKHLNVNVLFTARNTNVDVSAAENSPNTYNNYSKHHLSNFWPLISLPSGPMLMITEYCSHGDLLNFLRAHAQDFMESFLSVDEVEGEAFYKNMAAQHARLRRSEAFSHYINWIQSLNNCNENWCHCMCVHARACVCVCVCVCSVLQWQWYLLLLRLSGDAASSESRTNKPG